jgi:mRNA m6A methyltransferase non-catalytic subunit
MTILNDMSMVVNGPRIGSLVLSQSVVSKSESLCLGLCRNRHLALQTRYPKQQRLLNLKKVSVDHCALPSHFLSISDLPMLKSCKFDVILLDPPFSSSFTWQTLQELPIPSLAAEPSFVFLWVGSGAGDGLERGRELLAKWGYRRCEDVVWVKTNKTTNLGPGVRTTLRLMTLQNSDPLLKTDPPTTSLLTRTKQHCLIGIRGTVRRSTDNWFVHCNVGNDVFLGFPISSIT